VTRVTQRAAELCAVLPVAVLLVVWFAGCLLVSRSLDWKDTMKFSIRFVDDIRSRLYHFSTISLTIGTAAVGVWLMLPADLKNRLSPQTLDWTARGIFAVLGWGLLGKFIQQPMRTPKDEDATDPPKQP